MLTMVLNCYEREDEDKWKKMSKEVVDMLLPLLAKQQVNMIMSYIDMELLVSRNTVFYCRQVFVENEFGLSALQGVFQAVAPVSLRRADVLLKTLFVPMELVRDEL